MVPASALDYVLDPPAELRAVHPCEQGLVLLRTFLSQPGNSIPAAQPYREFRGNPSWRAFTQHWVHCVACQEGGSDWQLERHAADSVNTESIVHRAAEISQ